MSANPDLDRVRQEIDRVDKAMLDLIAERLALSADVRRAKAGAKLWRPSREDGHVAHLAERATHTGTPPALVSRIWAELMSASISVQGSSRIHVALEGDARANLSLIRDRFGGSLPVLSYPTSSNALAACYGEDEGIAVLPAPGGMNNWWTALAAGGAMPELKIVAPLPRIEAGDWPRAVAIAAIDLDIGSFNRDGRILCASRDVMPGLVRAESGDLSLYEISATEDVDARDVIGYLPPPVSV